jgi:hypothetical protein
MHGIGTLRPCKVTLRRDAGTHGMDKLGEYWAHAAECHRQANASATEHDKRQWLRMAQSWLGLIRTRKHGPDAQVQANTNPENAALAYLGKAIPDPDGSH